MSTYEENLKTLQNSWAETAKRGISVIITYCQADAHYLPRCLGSVIWQLEPQDQLIVVFDGNAFDAAPRDTAYDAIFPYDSLCTEIVGSGVSVARNVGLDAAAGAWVKFLDVDDVLAPFALESIRKYNPGAKVVVGGQSTMVNGQRSLEFLSPGEDQPGRVRNVVWHRNWDWIERCNPAVVSACFIRREVFVDLKFDPRIQFEEDWDLWLRIWKKFGDSVFGYLPARVCYYCVNEAERAEKEKTRSHEVDGIDVREYFRRTYGIEAK